MVIQCLQLRLISTGNDTASEQILFFSGMVHWVMLFIVADFQESAGDSVLQLPGAVLAFQQEDLLMELEQRLPLKRKQT
jgi:hypothetical protein